VQLAAKDKNKLNNRL